MFTTEQMQTMINNDGVVVGSDGAKIGKIGQVYVDDETGQPQWVTTKTGLFGGAETFVPLDGATSGDNEIQVPFDKATIKDAPRMDDAEGHLSPEQEAELYRYYKLQQDGQTVGEHPSAAHTDHATAAAGTVDGDASMVRSEEHLEVGTERVQTGRARLRKYVTTENVTTTVPVEREEVRVEREPVDASAAARGEIVADHDLGDAESEVMLTEERVTVSKETVPVEKVSLATETVVDNQEVNENVRSEQIETDVDENHTGR